MENTTYLTVAQAAKQLYVSRSTIYNYIKEGVLDYEISRKGRMKIIIIPVESVKQFERMYYRLDEPQD